MERADYIKKEIGHVQASLAAAMRMAEDAFKKKERECDDLRLKNSKLEEEKRVMIENTKKLELSKVNKETVKTEETLTISKLNEELVACKNECDELNEKVLRLEEKKKLFGDKKKMFMDREARGEERYRKLVEDGKREKEALKAKIAELERKIAEVGKEKQNANELVELYMCREIEMGERVSRLEKDIAILLVEHDDTITGGGPPSICVVAITDSDDEEMEDLCSTVPTPPHLKYSSVLKPCTQQSDWSESEDDWKSEKDIRSSLNKDPELCMRAVCALYKEQFFETKIGSDALRGTKLAEFLTDKRPRCALKRSITELRKHDSEGLTDCRRLGIKYSEKLFEIYLKYGDSRFILE